MRLPSPHSYSLRPVEIHLLTPCDTSGGIRYRGPQHIQLHMKVVKLRSKMAICSNAITMHRIPFPAPKTRAFMFSALPRNMFFADTEPHLKLPAQSVGGKPTASTSARNRLPDFGCLASSSALSSTLADVISNRSNFSPTKLQLVVFGASVMMVEI